MAVARLETGFFPPRSETASSPEIFELGNGKDLAYPYPDGTRPKTHRYEDRCFREIATAPQLGEVFVGPYAIDKFFSSVLPLTVRPDIMGFRVEDSATLSLRHLYEIRAGGLDFTRKVKGMNEFISQLRRNGHLKELFEILKIRKNPEVPDSKSVVLTFITPRERGDTNIRYEDTPFAKVDFQRIG